MTRTARSGDLPNSPPPSFHSRASSVAPRNRTVQDPTLADAFDADESDSDDEPDDRQRLVRQNSDPVQPAGSSAQYPAPYSPVGSSASTPPPQPPRSQPSAAATSSNRIFGSGIQNEGVFSNLTAKPERGGTEKEEMPPVRFHHQILVHIVSLQQFANPTVFASYRHTNKQQPTQHHPIGRQPSSPPAWAAPTTSTSTACLWAPYSRSCGTA